MHAINLDGDIGPWLQSVKLRGLKEFAAKQSIANLSGEKRGMKFSESLRGRRQGLEMMLTHGPDDANTQLLFARRAYCVNKMVIGGAPAEELLAESRAA